MKKVLLVNTKYRKFGGEDSNIIQEKAFDTEASLENSQEGSRHCRKTPLNGMFYK